MVLISSKRLGIKICFFRSSSGDGPVSVIFESKGKGIFSTITIPGAGFKPFKKFCNELKLTENTKALRKNDQDKILSHLEKKFSPQSKFVRYYAGVHIHGRPELMYGSAEKSIVSKSELRSIQNTGMGNAVSVGGRLGNGSPFLFEAEMDKKSFIAFRQLCYRALKKLHTLNIPHNQSLHRTRLTSRDHV